MTCPSAADPTVPCRFNGVCHETRREIQMQRAEFGIKCEWFQCLLVGPKMQNTPTEDTEQPF